MTQPSTAHIYAKRVAAWQPMTTAVTPYLIDALALRRGERVVDIGCGLAAATLRVGEIVGPSGAVVGVDVCDAVVETAARHVEVAGASNVLVRQADAECDTFPHGPFTAAMSQFGVMFFTDPAAAFTNIRRQLGANGRLCFTCWQPPARNPWVLSPALRGLSSAVDRPRTETSLSDPAVVRRVLAQSGFCDIDVTHRSLLVEVPITAVVDDAELTLMGVPNPRRAEAWERVNVHLAPYRTSASTLRLPLAFHTVTAHSTCGRRG